MSSNQPGMRFWTVAWWPVALMVVLIAVSSSATFGSDHTSGPLRWLWQAVFGPVSKARWNSIHVFIRKSGHFVGYGVLGLAWLRAWRISLPRMRFLYSIALAVLGTGLIASCDEFHQTLIPNRTGSPWDVLLDCCGAMAICVLARAISRRRRARQIEPTAVHSSS